MNRHDRRLFLGALDHIIAEIIKTKPSWESRWEAHCGCLQAMRDIGQERGISLDEIIRELGCEPATRLIKALGAPPVTDLFQALLYSGSSVSAHKIAAQAWMRCHPDEIMELQRQHPEVPLLMLTPSVAPGSETLH